MTGGIAPSSEELAKVAAVESAVEVDVGAKGKPLGRIRNHLPTAARSIPKNDILRAAQFPWERARNSPNFPIGCDLANGYYATSSAAARWYGNNVEKSREWILNSGPFSDTLPLRSCLIR